MDSYCPKNGREAFEGFFFSQMELPKEFLTDQGSNYMSSVMRGVCEALKIKRLWTFIHHLQMDGLVEWFNRTLKNM